ncbi:MAG: hypothetical protein Q8P67_08935, partial [archaeon]|nr:hypothetical protein [archaeon]
FFFGCGEIVSNSSNGSFWDEPDQGIVRLGRVDESILSSQSPELNQHRGVLTRFEEKVKKMIKIFIPTSF